MCGIFGYIGNLDACAVCIQGLKQLEYRGYDSAGIAGTTLPTLFVCKEIGKISSLEEKLKSHKVHLSCAITHTRWATHGNPSIDNAHPLLDEKHTVAVAHNGVIENYASLRDELISSHGVRFSSDTDTEVIAQLMGQLYQRDLFQAALKTFSQLEGSFAIALIHKDHPDRIIATAENSPLIIGVSDENLFVASDINALAGYELDLYALSQGEIADLCKGKAPQFFDKKGKHIKKTKLYERVTATTLSKGEFEHFMLKEIFEQPLTVQHAMLKRYEEKTSSVHFDELQNIQEPLQNIEHVLIIGCGTSLHAGYIAGYLFETLAHLPTRVEIASEYRYKTPVILPNTLVLALSQSGETADTLAALKGVKQLCSAAVALCNVPGSSITREVDATIFLHAGPEVAVASTKTFTSQMVILYLLAFHFGKMKKLPQDALAIGLKKLYELPEQVTEILNQAEEIKALAKKYAHAEDIFFLGRHLLYPTALEAALKLKEIAYVNAQGYPAGEMKHGPIALLCTNVPAVIFCADERLQPKVMSNLMESKARGAPIIAFSYPQFKQELKAVCDDIFYIPKTSDALAPILLTVATQLFAYYIAKERGTDIDKPRNLAKSVTVE